MQFQSIPDAPSDMADTPTTKPEIAPKEKPKKKLSKASQKQITTKEADIDGADSSHRNSMVDTSPYVSPRKSVLNEYTNLLLPNDKDNGHAEVLDCRIAEKIKSELENRLSSLNAASTSATATASVAMNVVEPSTSSSNTFVEKLPTKAKKKVIFKEKQRKQKKNDVTSEVVDSVAPMADDLLSAENLSKKSIKTEARRIKKKRLKNNKDNERDEVDGAPPKGDGTAVPRKIATKTDISSTTTVLKCQYCKVRHNGDDCPIVSSHISIPDSLSYLKWLANVSDEDEDQDGVMVSYAEASLPLGLEIKTTENQSGVGVYAKQAIAKYTRLGPLQGALIDEVDIADDNTMEYMFETNDGDTSTFINVEDEMKSNWLRFVRPAHVSKERCAVVLRDDKDTYLITTRDIAIGEEIVYWSDKCNTRWKKNVGSKTSMVLNLMIMFKA